MRPPANELIKIIFLFSEELTEYPIQGLNYFVSFVLEPYVIDCKDNGCSLRQKKKYIHNPAECAMLNDDYISGLDDQIIL
jgi:hypothetical protein